MIIPLWVKLAAVGLLVAVLAGMGWKLRDIIAENETLRSQHNALVDRVVKAEENVKALDAAVLERDTEHNNIRSATADVTLRIKQESSRDPNLAGFLHTPIPDGLRRAVLEAAAERAATERERTSGADED